MIFISAVRAENDKGTACAVMPVSKALWRIFDCGRGFRSPQWSHFSETPLPVNVQGRLTAASLASQAPGGKIVAARFIRLMPSACRVGVEPASLQAVPSARIPAGRPGQPSTPHRFSAGPGSSLQRSDFQLNLFCCLNKKRRWSGVGWSG